MRRFLVEGWGRDSIPTVVWCRGIMCDSCQLRFSCFTMGNDDFIIESRKEWMRGMAFNGKRLPLHIESYHIDLEGNVISRGGMHIETIIDFLIAGEDGQRIPHDPPTLKNVRWNHGWTYQAGVQCSYLKLRAHDGSNGYCPCVHRDCGHEQECKRGMRKAYKHNGEILSHMRGGELTDGDGLSLIVDSGQLSKIGQLTP